MDIETRKYLTEKVLGECWHKTDRPTQRCLYCGMKLMYFNHHIFTTRDDMMDLYEAIVKRGEFSSIFNYLHGKCDWKELDPIRDNVFEYLFKWIICLSGESYEDRCQMVVDWVKEASHES